jgi:predicted TIM-barrel fold metal-dependent hydrolase
MLSYSKYIIDAHAHIFPEKIAQKATDNIGSFYDLYMNFDGTADMLIKQGDECGVSKYVVQSVATVPHQVKRINDFIVKSVEKYPDKLIGFGSLHPDMKGMEEEIDRLISLGLHGIKLHPDFQKFAINRFCRKILTQMMNLLVDLFQLDFREFRITSSRRHFSVNTLGSFIKLFV